MINYATLLALVDSGNGEYGQCVVCSEPATTRGLYVTTAGDVWHAGWCDAADCLVDHSETHYVHEPPTH